VRSRRFAWPWGFAGQSSGRPCATRMRGPTHLFLAAHSPQSPFTLLSEADMKLITPRNRASPSRSVRDAPAPIPSRRGRPLLEIATAALIVVALAICFALFAVYGLG
jgi:hypothetical protein